MKNIRNSGNASLRSILVPPSVQTTPISVTTNDIRQLAHDKTSSWKVAQKAMELGMRSLRQDGWRKVIAGSSTIDEITRNAKADHSLLIKR